VSDRFVTECPAKINLVLRVGNADKRGYHPLETEFQAVSLADTLEVILGKSGFETVGMNLPESNTLAKTLRLMREVASLPVFGMRLTKRIPARAGLGGGSSDAAGLLRILREILPGVVPDRDFMAVARSVGADVPFFLVGGRATGVGYGDIVTAQPDQETHWLVLISPGIDCSTPEMYALLDAQRQVRLEYEDRRWIENDFHAVAPPQCLELMQQLAEAGCHPVGLSGSGSSVFGFADSEAEARHIAELIKGSQVVRTLGREESLKVVRKG
jgi:4-diphosphocytidyl-2-C-methyl-D-erythritol kinase